MWQKMTGKAQIVKIVPGRDPGRKILLFYIYLPEQMFAEGIDFIARDLFSDWLKNGRVGNHNRRHLIVHHLLRLLVQRHAFFAIGYRF